MEFKKLSEVTIAETTSESTNVLIEDSGEVKRVAMDQISVPQTPQEQANWNETDETSPAFILNKPEKLGGYTYFAISDNGYMFKTEDFAYPSDAAGAAPNVSRAEFEDAYKTSPIMLIPSNDSLKQSSGTSVTPSPCARYHLNTGGYPHVTYMNYTGYLMVKAITFSDGESFTS